MSDETDYEQDSYSWWQSDDSISSDPDGRVYPRRTHKASGFTGWVGVIMEGE